MKLKLHQENKSERVREREKHMYQTTSISSALEYRSNKEEGRRGVYPQEVKYYQTNKQIH